MLIWHGAVPGLRLPDCCDSPRGVSAFPAFAGDAGVVHEAACAFYRTFLRLQVLPIMMRRVGPAGTASPRQVRTRRRWRPATVFPGPYRRRRAARQSAACPITRASRQSCTFSKLRRQSAEAVPSRFRLSHQGWVGCWYGSWHTLNSTGPQSVVSAPSSNKHPRIPFEYVYHRQVSTLSIGKTLQVRAAHKEKPADESVFVHDCESSSKY